MLRRRLVLSSSSDEEDEQPIHNHRPLPNPNPHPNRFSDQPLEISDDDDGAEFVDVSDNLPPPPPASPGDSAPIRELLLGLGLRVRRDWVDSCLGGLELSVPGFGSLEVGAKAKLCFERFLASDMNFSGSGVLPENLDELHLVDLPGPFVLQVDEIVNISCPLKSRYQKAPPGVKRCLKLSLTDGVRRVFGMEYRPIKDLDALSPAGLKVVICNVHIRHGLLMLVPEAFEVLGGLVEELEAARQRLVEEVNKPPRGIRTRNRLVPPLRDRATLAAWTTNVDHVAAGPTNNTMAEYTTPFQVRPRGASTHVAPRNDSNRRTEEEFPGIVSEESVIRNPTSDAIRTSVEVSIPSGEESAFPNQIPSGDISMDSTVPPDVFMGAEDDDDIHMYTVPDSTTPAVPNSLSNIASVVEDMDTYPSGVANPVSDPSFNNFPNDEEMTNSIPSPTLNNLPNGDAEVLEVEHPLILSGAREAPFTYMASLTAKWISMKESTPSVKGIIKCFLTGVKRFQFRDQPTYELQVYVDDGSLISEILIHHDLVQKMVGFSSLEVSAALVCSAAARANSMKEIMRQFQTFLANFEGKMLVEMNKISPLPVALEMTTGCTESDARLLLRRLKSFIRAPNQPSVSMDPIYLSP